MTKMHLDDMGIDERGEYILDLEEQIGDLKAASDKSCGILFEVLSATVFQMVQLEKKIEEHEQSFELYHSACVRGIQLWEKEDPVSREMISPDQAQLVAWLLALVERAENSTV